MKPVVIQCYSHFIYSEITTKIENNHTPTTPSDNFFGDTVDFDTFDHILSVTAEHEAVYAYYYMDENNKVRKIDFWERNGFTVTIK